MPEMENIHETEPDSNELAMERTMLAHERTLMSWLRTAMSLMSFGFTIYKFFAEISNTPEGQQRLLTPRIRNCDNTPAAARATVPTINITTNSTNASAW